MASCGADNGERACNRGMHNKVMLWQSSKKPTKDLPECLRRPCLIMQDYAAATKTCFALLLKKGRKIILPPRP
ncbi:MAG TPA: hypothetical protein DEB58_03950 [Alphaproteobacteria bacterium]|nr:hypothetical protein [Alphaproteobacteria bacterium]